MKFIDNVHDRDSSNDVWEKSYRIVYRNFFANIFDFENISDTETSAKCKRFYAKINKEKNLELRKKYPKFKMAGDCDFNFNDKKIELVKKFLRDEDYGLLKSCHDNHHELWNFSFMPITGGMNNIKGRLRSANNFRKETYSFDRLDVFIHELSLYYEQESNCIPGRYNKDALNWFLHLEGINTIYKYCKEVYLIDDEIFVDELISSGCKPIVDRESAIKYMKLAKKYWQYKKNKLESMGINIV